MKRQNQLIALFITHLFAQLYTPPSAAIALLMQLIIGGWLELAAGAATPIAPQKPAPAKTLASDILIVQAVVDTLPPPPQSVDFNRRKRSLPSFRPRELDFQAPRLHEYSPNFEQRYLVYVNEADLARLQQVQQLEPTAFVRQYKGRSVIQAGVFRQKFYAAQLVKDLESRGIGARLVSLSTGQENNLRLRENSRSYFVVIPASHKDLPLIEDKVRQLRADVPVGVSQKDQPRGPHVRVGPFKDRGVAERWNRYLLKYGLKNARVYYGH